MKMKGFIFIGLMTILLSGCKTTDDFTFEFPNNIECQEYAFDFIEIESLGFPDKIDEGYFYTYLFDFGKYEFTFHNPDYVYERDEFLTLSAAGNRFLSEDGAFRRIEVPENYYLYEVKYIYASMCSNSTHEEEISLNLDKSFLYYSENKYEESEFREIHSDLFE